LNNELLRFVMSRINSSDRVFTFFLQHPDQVDHVIKMDGEAQNTTDLIVRKEFINSKLWTGTGKARIPIVQTPDWDTITRAVSLKFGDDCAERNLLIAKINWYGLKKDTPNLIKYHVEQIDRYGLELKGYAWKTINNMIYSDIFEHSEDKELLLKAANWAETIMQAHPGYPEEVDTYANLLYKIGRTQEAIAEEGKAVQIEEANAAKRNGSPDKVYRETLEKMKKGLPTWETN